MTTDRFNRPFTPIDVHTSTQAITGTTASEALVLTSSLLGGHVPNLRVVNDGTVTVFIAFGGSGVVAVVADDMPILPGTVEIFTMPGNIDAITHFAGIASGAGSTIYVTVGYGI